MKKILPIICLTFILMLTFSCGNNKSTKAEVAPVDTVEVVEVDTVAIDTFNKDTVVIAE